MRTLYVTDLDGTLLGPDSRVSDVSARTITDLSRRGALITIATARTPATVEPLLHDTLTSIPAIVLTGASMWDRSRHIFIDPTTLTADAAIRLEATFLQHGINPFVYNLYPDGTMRVLHVPAMTPDEARFYEERKALKLKRFILLDSPLCPLSDNLNGNDRTDETATPTPTILMLGIGDTPTVNRLADTLRQDPQYSVSAYPDIFDDARSYIEVFHAGISKATAVLRLKDMLKADRVVVYGDHINDLPMFAVADESVAVANAHPSVRAAATRTIGPNTLPSVALDIASQFSASLP